MRSSGTYTISGLEFDWGYGTEYGYNDRRITTIVIHEVRIVDYPELCSWMVEIGPKEGIETLAGFQEFAEELALEYLQENVE